MITEEQKNMLLYFWEEKGDIERYCDFENVLPELQKQYPEVLKAWNDYKISKRTLTSVLKSIQNGG